MFRENENTVAATCSSTALAARSAFSIIALTVRSKVIMVSPDIVSTAVKAKITSFCGGLAYRSEMSAEAATIKVRRRRR